MGRWNLQADVDISHSQNSTTNPDVVVGDSSPTTQFDEVDVMPISQQTLYDHAWQNRKADDLMKGAEMSSVLDDKDSLATSTSKSPPCARSASCQKSI